VVPVPIGPYRSFRSPTRLTRTQNSTDSEMKDIALEPRIGLLERTGRSPALDGHKQFEGLLTAAVGPDSRGFVKYSLGLSLFASQQLSCYVTCRSGWSSGEYAEETEHPAHRRCARMSGEWRLLLGLRPRTAVVDARAAGPGQASLSPRCVLWRRKGGQGG